MSLCKWADSPEPSFHIYTKCECRWRLRPKFRPPALYICKGILRFFLCVCLLFDLIPYVPSTIFQLNRDRSSWVEPVLSQDKCVLLKDHNAVMPVRLKPAALRSRVKHSTTEPLHSLSDVVFIVLINVKMPTTVGILTFMNRINFVLSWVENEKSFITLGPGESVQTSRLTSLHFIYTQNVNVDEDSGQNLDL